MKKIVWTLLFSMLLMTASPFLVLVSADEALPLLWDGTSAEGFAGGDGSEEDPFRIETAEQFACFRDRVNEGESFNGKYVKLCADIRLNDETFTFDADTGLVKVTDGEHVAYYGTGKVGDDSGDNTVFDTSASTRDKWYDESFQRIQNYPGTIHSWIGIGLSAESYLFRGNFDGAGHTVSGAFGRFNQNGGLFSFVVNCTLENLQVEDSFFAGTGSVGGVVNRIYNDGIELLRNRTVIRACSFDGIVVGSAAGGIVGQMEKSSDILLCENKGTVIGSSGVGGILGRGEQATCCINNGRVYGGSYVGGIIGNCEKLYSIVAVTEPKTPGARQCTNKAVIRGASHVGGICGITFYQLQNCHNTADVYGSGNYVGGIAGSGSTDRCYNTGNVTGGSYVGGINGAYTTTNATNLGAVSGTDIVGGIVGYGNSNGCENYGDVSGETQVGGIAGRSNDPINNCHNHGAVTGGNGPVGGIAGVAFHDVGYCYNLGAVTGKDSGTLVGRYDTGYGRPLLSYSYYSEGCAVDHLGNLRSAIGVNRVNARTESVQGCTLDAMELVDTYVGFDFNDVWMWGGQGYPVLRFNQTPHGTTYTMEEHYLYKQGACGTAAQYRASCTCGAVLDEFFVSIEPSSHSYAEAWDKNASAHWQACLNCGEHASEDLHSYAEIGVVETAEGGYEVLLYCSVCEYEMHVPFDYKVPSQTPPKNDDDPIVQKPIQTPVDTPKKAEMKPDIRFVLLLAAGVVLGAMGFYGVSVVRKTRKEVKKKQKMSKNFI